MTRRRTILASIMASALMLIIFAGPPRGFDAQAQAPATGLASEGLTVPYTGQLSDDAGQPVVDGAYDLALALYDAETGGEPLWTEVQTGVAVRGGNLATLLGAVNRLPKEMVERDLWLEVALRGPDELAFTMLTPRQLLSSGAPEATSSSSCAHTHLYEWWEGSHSAYGLVVDNRYGSGDGIRGYSSSPASNYAGVYGVNFNAGPGVYGRSDSGGPGVTGFSGTGFGMYAAGNDSSAFDTKGDLLLGGDYGEIFATGNLLNLYSNGFVVIDLDDDNNSPNQCFRVLNGADGILWSVCETTGVVAASSQASMADTADYGQRLLYAVEGAGKWVEDVGTAALNAGEATIRFDRVFAQTVDLAEPYQVFVTPISQEPIWLYITAKTTGDFTVRGVTLDGEPATCSFDYRIIAQRLGHENTRLESFEPAFVRGDE
jgi:hypothetical protein